MSDPGSLPRLSDGRRFMVRYHEEDGTWWADCEDMPSWAGVASTLDELRRMAAEAIPFVFDAPGKAHMVSFFQAHKNDFVKTPQPASECFEYREEAKSAAS